MRLFNWIGRALLTALAVVGLAGCLKNSEQEAARKSPDALSVTFDTLADTRDGNVYRTVRIGNQVWMADNLNIKADSSWCYENSPDSCAKYGRLYTWEAARTVCPGGWHLPTRQEWNELVNYAGGTFKAGEKLKSTSGWSGGSSYNGTDNYGFSALPGGYRGLDGSFVNAGYGGDWWTAAEGENNNAYFRYMNYNYDYVVEAYLDKGGGFSVRCVGDGLVHHDRF